jgi:hypothetical protein
MEDIEMVQKDHNMSL